MTASPCRTMSQIVGSHGSSIPCSLAGSAYATVPVVDQHPECFTSLSSASQNYGDTQRWKRPQFLQKGVLLGACLHRKTIETDASLTGWGAVHQECPVRGVWSEEQRSWHINSLEPLAVYLSLGQFSPQLMGYHVLIRMDNMTVVSYLIRRGLHESACWRKQSHNINISYNIE